MLRQYLNLMRRTRGSRMAVFGGSRTASDRSGASGAATQDMNEVRKLDEAGNPAKGDQLITPLIVHKGLIYISGQGANDNGPVEGMNIEVHTRKVLDNVKRLVEAGGGSMESILELTVYLATLEDYDAMNKVYYGTYFPRGGPKRTTIAVTGIPGRSLLEINCIAAVTQAQSMGS